MLDQSKTDRLLALLQAQQREAVARSGFVRGTNDWLRSSDRLDALNDRIMHPDPARSIESVGPGLGLDLDSRPDGDGPFRRTVLTCVRSALAAAARDRLPVTARERAASGEEPFRLARSVLQAAEGRLRADYPDATLSTLAVADSPAILIVRADRRGRIA